MTRGLQRLLFALFFLSGFCGLLYQVVWTRMAFAAFGVITPVLSVVISVFMLGLAAGSWAGGKWISRPTAGHRLPAAACYALAELVIGLGAFAVPVLFQAGKRLLLSAGQGDSATYLFFSALVLGISILPWCVCMGATFPLMMAYVRERDASSSHSFSFLYLANVLGATAGTLLSALVFVELWGFKGTLGIAAVANFTIAAIAAGLAFAARGVGPVGKGARSAEAIEYGGSDAGQSPGFTRWVLFITGFAAMAMEVVWTRAFAPVLKTQVYSFALIVATYLLATFLGSWFYRRDLRRKRPLSTPVLLGALSAAAFLPVLANDFRFVDVRWWRAEADPTSALLVLAAIVPFCALLGYLTPRLIDEYSRGAPSGAGSAYALNVVGCILGPLFASYGLLPWLSERYCLVLLGLPFLALWLSCPGRVTVWPRVLTTSLSLALLVIAVAFSRTYDERLLASQRPAAIHRDYAASVLSFGQGQAKELLVNGLGMTSLTPITKFMAHLPLGLHEGRPSSALVICLGMGTSFRAALSWGIDTTAVELVPGVKDAFGFYHADTAQVLANPRGRIIVDDGRRFLERAGGIYDAIIIDPPPPVQAAGSSLLYSEEFYAQLKPHLKPGGIVQNWVPVDPTIARAALRSLCNSFPHVVCFNPVEGQGLHMLASMEPIKVPTPAEFAARMPASALDDLVEWRADHDAAAYLGEILSLQIPNQGVLSPDPRIRITDDRPYNEYYLLRTLRPR